MAKLIHSMIRVLDADKSLAFYNDVLGLREVHRLDFPEFALVYLRNDENDVELELTWNKGRSDPYTHGTGYGHIAVAVEDLESEHARLSKLGYTITPPKRFERGHELLAHFFFITDPDGYKIEVLQRDAHYR